MDDDREEGGWLDEPEPLERTGVARRRGRSALRDLVIPLLALAAVVAGIVAVQMLRELNEPREPISIGEVLYGAFLVQTPLGPAMSARGAEDWGDNAYLNDYPECGAVIAVTTSRGPAEGAGEPLFRDRLIKSIEEALAPYCGKA